MPSSGFCVHSQACGFAHPLERKKGEEELEAGEGKGKREERESRSTRWLSRYRGLAASPTI